MMCSGSWGVGGEWTTQRFQEQFDPGVYVTTREIYPKTNTHTGCDIKCEIRKYNGEKQSMLQNYKSLSETHISPDSDASDYLEKHMMWLMAFQCLPKVEASNQQRV